MSPADRAKAAHAAAEAARDAGADPRDVAALKAAASLWERVAGPGLAWSHRRLQADLRQLRIDVVVSRGPFQPPRPPKAAPPAQVPLADWVRAGARSRRRLPSNSELAPRRALM